MDKKLGQEPAFASLMTDKTITSEGLVTDYYMGGFNGMSTRLYIATMAMQGLLSGNYASLYDSENAKTPDNSIIKLSFEYADELLKLENE